MIGVVIPASNEELLLAACLTAVRRAAGCPRLAGEPVEICVVLDACTDGSLGIAHAHGTHALCIAARNVGRARAEGARHLLACGARWLAFTDADSEVAEDWLAEQLDARADAVCGTVSIHDWSEHPVAVRARYELAYDDADGHRHVHGANLGVTGAAYRAVGGFEPRLYDEDVTLVAALERAAFRVVYSARPRVRTSARLDARAPHGFSKALRALHDAELPRSARVVPPEISFRGGT